MKYMKDRRWGNQRQMGKKRSEGNPKRTKKKQETSELKVGDKIKITGFDCGSKCHERYSCMGMIIDREMEITSIQPFGGPVTVKWNNSEFTIGVGMLGKLKFKKI